MMMMMMVVVVVRFPVETFFDFKKRLRIKKFSPLISFAA